MKRIPAILILLALVLLGALIFYLAPEREVVAPDVGEVTPPPAAAPVSPPPSTPSAPPEVDIAALESTAEMRAYRERQQFEQSVRDFLAEADTLGDAERAARAQVLVAQVDRYEQAGQLSAAEAVTLRLALLRETTDDAGYAAASERIMAEYAERSEAAMAEFIANQPPAFTDYKAREREIVREVQQMTEFPGGMTRAQYLRQQLQAAREESYRSVR